MPTTSSPRATTDRLRHRYFAAAARSSKISAACSQNTTNKLRSGHFVTVSLAHRLVARIFPFPQVSRQVAASRRPHSDAKQRASASFRGAAPSPIRSRSRRRRQSQGPRRYRQCWHRTDAGSAATAASETTSKNIAALQRNRVTRHRYSLRCQPRGRVLKSLGQQPSQVVLSQRTRCE